MFEFFKSPKAVNKAVDGLYDGIDAAIYTQEEKMADIKEMYKLYEPFKHIQRVIVLAVVPPYMLCWLITFLTSFFADVEVQKALLGGRIGDVVLAIVSFYFLGGAAEGTLRGVKALRTKISAKLEKKDDKA